MIENYDYMTDEELIRHIQNSTEMERLLAKRLEKCMDRHEIASESVYVQTTLATKGGRSVTPEGKVKAAVRELLNKYGAYWHCPVQNGMGKPSLDFIGCHRGRYFAVETKADGKKMTKRQEMTAEEIIAADGRVFEVVGTSGLAALQHWLTCNQMEV